MDGCGINSQDYRKVKGTELEKHMLLDALIKNEVERKHLIYVPFG